MTEKTWAQNNKTDAENAEITFKCRFCERTLPVKEMMVVNRFFPPLVACRECEKIVG